MYDLSNLPDVHKHDRTIPPGKVLVSEYGRVPADDPRARPITLATRKAWGRTEVRLEAIPAGWACAGSMMRWDNGCFAVRYDFHGATHGSRFRTITDALERFHSLPE